MAFPRGEEPTLDELRESSGFDAGVGGDDESSDGDFGGGGGELPSADFPVADSGGEQQGGARKEDLTLAVRQYRDELKQLKAARDMDTAELRELRQWRAEVQSAIREQRAEEARRAQEAAKNADPEPDPILEPDKHEEWKARREQARFEEVNQNLQQTQRAVQEQRQMLLAQTIENSVRDSITNFSRTKPDYDAAYNFLVENVANGFRRMGYSDPEIFGEGGKLYQERDRLFRQIIEIHPSGAWRWAQDPAAALYNAAVQYGWNAAAQPGATQPANGRRPANAQRRPARDPAALERAAAAAAGAGGGATTAGEQLTAEKLLNMSPRERAWLEHTRPDLVERILESVSR
jgi:hypothetical protein